MSEQVLVQSRMDKDLKQEVAEIYESLGMDLPTAIRVFFVKSKMVKGCPFDLTLPQDYQLKSDKKNAAATAMKIFQEEMRGEAERAGLNTDEDIVAFMKEIRAEVNSK